MYNQELNNILLNRKLKVFLPVNNENNKFPDYAVNVDFIENFDQQLNKIGFKLSNSLKSAIFMSDLSEEELRNFAKNTYDELCKQIGNDVKHKPMYKDFPHAMKVKSDEQLEDERRMGYLVDFMSIVNSEILDQTIDLREVYFNFNDIRDDIIEDHESGTIKTIGYISQDETYEMFKNLLSQKNPLSEYDKECLHYAFKNLEIDRFMPEDIPMKENLAFAYNELKNEAPDKLKQLPIKTQVDVLRLAVARDGGDISLSEKHHFNNMPRSERRQFLSLMEKVVKTNGVNQSLEDMERYSEVFKRFGEVIHAGDYNKQFPLVNQTLNMLRDNEKARTFNRSFDNLYKQCDNEENCEKLFKLLESRPGEYARKLDMLIVNKDIDNDKLLESFDRVVDRVPTDVLFNLRKHFENRSVESDDKVRLIMPKGPSQKFYTEIDTREPLDKELVEKINGVITKGIDLRLEFKEPINEEIKYYIDPEMQHIKLPSNNRSSSKGFRTLTRGSSIGLPVEGKNVLRAFVYWEGRDIDLSMGYLDKNFKSIGEITYYQLRDGKKFTTYHSGDITNAPKGASEFIDVKLDQFKESHPEARYLIFTTHVYNGPCFANHEKCFMGIMNREGVNSKEPYDPKTVVSKFDITNTGYSAANILYDIYENRMYWLDMQIDRYNYAFRGIESLNNYSATEHNYSMLAKGLIDSDKADLKTIIEENIKVRGGTLVDDREKADVVVSMDGNITPFDMEKIIVEYVDSKYKNYDELLKLREERFENTIKEHLCNSGVDKEEVEKLNKEDLLDKFDEMMNTKFKEADFNGRYHAYLVEQMGEKFVEKLNEEITKSQEENKNH